MGSGPSNPLVHLELYTPNVDAACEFYSNLCAWRPKRIDPGYERYRSIEIGGEIGGGVVGSSGGWPLWMPYVLVDSAPRAAARAREFGAAVLLERREGPAGCRSVVRSPAGGPLAFWQPKR